MNLQRFIVILGLVLTMGVLVTYQHARVMHAGFELSRLTREKETLIDRQRTLAAEVAEEKRPEVVRAQLRRWRLHLVPPPESGAVTVSDEQVTEHER